MLVFMSSLPLHTQISEVSFTVRKNWVDIFKVVIKTFIYIFEREALITELIFSKYFQLQENKYPFM